MKVLLNGYRVPARLQSERAAVEALQGVLAEAALLGPEPRGRSVPLPFVVGVDRRVGCVLAVAGHLPALEPKLGFQ